jgi:hypothetical protein
MYPMKSKTLEDCKHIIKDKIMPGILNMNRFLGLVNYSDEFIAHQRKRQLNWEFEDKKTHSTFRPTLFGKVASPSLGTLLKDPGNYKPSTEDPVHFQSLISYKLIPNDLLPSNRTPLSRMAQKPKTSSFFNISLDQTFWLRKHSSTKLPCLTKSKKLQRTTTTNLIEYISSIFQPQKKKNLTTYKYRK